MDGTTTHRLGVNTRSRRVAKRGLRTFGGALAFMVVTVAMSASAYAQAAGGGLGMHLAAAAGTDLVNAAILWSTLKYLLAGVLGIVAGYGLYAIGKRNHHFAANPIMVACAAGGAVLLVSWGPALDAAVQTVWQAAPSITNATAVTPEQW